MTARGVLVAGIGNVFLGDDGFGVEVIRRLGPSTLADDVVAADYGIRGVHLAYDLLETDYRSLILVDALPRGEQPGTVSVLEVDPDSVTGAPALDSHVMNPEAVLGAVRALGGELHRVLVIGCEPQTVEPGIGLSPPVEAAVDSAVELVRTVAATERSAAWTPSSC